MRQTIKRWGNSPGIRIPGHLMALLNINVESIVELNVVRDANNVARLVIEPVNEPVSLEALVSQITPENIHGEADFGEVGKESW